MNDEIQLADFIEQLTVELTRGSNDAKMLACHSAEVEVLINASKDQQGYLRFSVASPECKSDTRQPHKLKIKLALNPEPLASQTAGQSSIQRNYLNTELTLADDLEDEFEGFKKRFKESVRRNHGVPPNKKNNVFD